MWTARLQIPRYVTEAGSERRQEAVPVEVAGKGGKSWWKEQGAVLILVPLRYLGPQFLKLQNLSK